MNEQIKKIGAFPGKFLPPHLGHVSMIRECAKKCDELWVVVSDSAKNSKALCAKAGIPFMSAKLRIKWLKRHFKNEPYIKIKYLNEDKLSTFPAPMAEWSAAFKKATKHKVNMKFADESYRELNELHFPECEFVCFDRLKINVSGTKIRTEPKKFFDFIIPEAKPFFRKIILKQNKK